MQGLGSGAITLFGSEEQKDSYLPKVGSGENWAFAISEASGGSDVAAMKTTAELRETNTASMAQNLDFQR